MKSGRWLALGSSSQERGIRIEDERVERELRGN